MKYSCNDFDRRILGIIQRVGPITADQIQNVLYRNRKYKWWFGPSYGKVHVSLEKLEQFKLIEGKFVGSSFPRQMAYNLV